MKRPVLMEKAFSHVQPLNKHFLASTDKMLRRGECPLIITDAAINYFALLKLSSCVGL